MDRADKARLRTPWTLRLFRARRLRDLRARAGSDPAASAALADELFVCFMDALRRERFDEALTTYGYALLEQGRRAEAEAPLVEGVALARTLRSEGEPGMEPLVRSGLTVLAAVRMDDSLVDEALGVEDRQD